MEHSDAPPKISISVSCVIFQGGSLLITQKCGIGLEFYEFYHNNLNYFSLLLFFVFLVIASEWYTFGEKGATSMKATVFFFRIFSCFVLVCP